MQEPTLEFPLITQGQGKVTIQFADGHPGASDPAYVRQRESIASLTLSYVPGAPIPRVGYTDQQHDLWRALTSELAKLHAATVCAEVLEGMAALALPDDHVPELADVSSALHGITGFSLQPAVGTAEPADFYQALHDRIFPATQYLRHHPSPGFSPDRTSSMRR